MSSVPITEADLQAYVDHVLAENRRAEVEAYIAERPDVARRLADYGRQNDMLHQLFDPVLVEPVPESLRKPSTQAKPRSPMMRHAAIVGWLALGGVIGWGINAWQADADPGFPRQAAVAHAVYSVEAKRHVEVTAADEQAMVGWMSKRMGVQISVPKLADLGFELLGGRLLPGARGPACQIMYQDKEGRRITLYMAREDGNTRQDLRVTKEGALQVAYWLDGVLGYAISGDLAKPELLQLVQSVARQVQR
jgi:anti-sigma factor RsiW